MIEITGVKYDPTEEVTVNAERFRDLLETEDSAISFYKSLKQAILAKYIENYACFGNGGGFTCEELADLLSIELPQVKHVGMDEWMKLKRFKNGKETETSV